MGIQKTASAASATASAIAAINTEVTAKTTVSAATTSSLPPSTYSNGVNGVGATIEANVNDVFPPQDGVSLLVDDLLLVKDEVPGLRNGRYTVTDLGSASNKWKLTRDTRADEADEFDLNQDMYASKGNVNADQRFTLISDGPFIIGTTSLDFQISSAELTELGVRSTLTPEFVMSILNDEPLTADHGITFTLDNADRKVTISGDIALDQDLRIDDSPTFATLGIRSSGLGAFDMILANTENLTMADKTLTVTLGDANISLDFSSPTDGFVMTSDADGNASWAVAAASESLSATLTVGNTTETNDIIVTAGQKITTDTVNETTAAAGVTIDSVLLKDGGGTFIATINSNVAAVGDGTGGIVVQDVKTDAALQMGEYAENDITIASNISLNGGFGGTAKGTMYLADSEAALYFDGTRKISARTGLTLVDFNGQAFIQIDAVAGVDRILFRAENFEFTNITSKMGFYGAAAVAQQAQTVDLKDVFVTLGFIESAGGATPLNLDGGTLTSPKVEGNTTASGTLTLSSTSNATKGKILFGTSAYDEVNNRLGIGTPTPSQNLTVKASASTGAILLENSSGVDHAFITTTATGGGLILNDVTGSTIFRFNDSAGGDDFINTGNNLSIGAGVSATAKIHTRVDTSAGAVFIAKFEGGGGSIPALMVRDDGNVGIGTSTPNIESLLELESTTKALRFTRMTTTQRTAMTGASGFLVLDTTLGFVFYHTGSAWIQL